MHSTILLSIFFTTRIHLSCIHNRKKRYKIGVHCAKGEGENKNLNKMKEYSGIELWVDSDFAGDIATRRSVSSLIYEYNGLAFA